MIQGVLITMLVIGVGFPFVLWTSTFRVHEVFITAFIGVLGVEWMAGTLNTDNAVGAAMIAFAIAIPGAVVRACR